MNSVAIGFGRLSHIPHLTSFCCLTHSQQRRDQRHAADPEPEDQTVQERAKSDRA